jgi:hypothetical protein
VLLVLIPQSRLPEMFQMEVSEKSISERISGDAALRQSEAGIPCLQDLGNFARFSRSVRGGKCRG